MANEWGDEEANEWGDLPASAPAPAAEPGVLDRVKGALPYAGILPFVISKIAGAQGGPPTKFSQKLGEGMLPGFNRVSAAAQAAADPLLGRTEEWGPDFGARFDEHLRANRGQSAETQAELPVVSSVLQAAGAVPAALATGAAPAVGRLPSLVQGAAQGAGFGGSYAAGDTRAEDASGMLGDFVKGAGTGAVLGGAFGAAMPGLPARNQAGELPAAPPTITDDLAAWLREKAGNRNIKAAGGIQSDITRARKQLGPGGANDGRAALQEIGAEMGDKGLVGPLSTPAKTFDRAAALMDDAGGRMGQLLDGADAAAAANPNTPTPSLGNILSEAMKPLAELKKNPNPGAQAAAERLESTLGRYVDIIGKDKLTFREAHQLRKWISDEVYGMRGTKDPWADSFKDALHSLRSIISREIDSTLDQATAASPAWRSANRDYQVASKALEFADKGIDRATGNNMVSPMEMIAALTGAGIGSAHGGAGITLGGLAAAGGTALARRHGSGTLGFAAQEAANVLRSTPTGVPALPNASPAAADPLILQMIEALKGRRLVAEPLPVAADEGNR